MRRVDQRRGLGAGIKAFTLLEVIAALAIISVSMLAVLQMLAFGSRCSTNSQRSLIAVNLLQKKMEEIKAKDFSADVSENGFAYSNYPAYLFDVTQATGYLGNPFLKRVDVKILWPTPFGADQEQTVSTLIADRP